MIDLKDLSPMDVTPAERALLLIIRNLGNGFIEGLGVAKGQPTVMKNVTERMDLSSKDQLSEVLETFGTTLLLPGRSQLPLELFAKPESNDDDREHGAGEENEA